MREIVSGLFFKNLRLNMTKRSRLLSRTLPSNCSYNINRGKMEFYDLTRANQALNLNEESPIFIQRHVSFPMPFLFFYSKQGGHRHGSLILAVIFATALWLLSTEEVYAEEKKADSEDVSSLLNAVFNNDIEQVRKILDSLLEIDHEKKIQILNQLNKMDEFHNNALHIAMALSYFDMAHLLLERLPELLSEKNEKCITPLMILADNSKFNDFLSEKTEESIGFKKLLLSHIDKNKSSLTEKDKNNLPALCHALEAGNFEMADVLFREVGLWVTSHGKLEAGGVSLLSYIIACMEKHPEYRGQYNDFVKTHNILDPRMIRLRSNRKGDSALLQAARCGELELLKEMIEKLGGPEQVKKLKIKSNDEETLVIAAVRSGRHDLVEHLLASGFPVQDKKRAGVTALMVAVKKGDKRMVDLLLKDLEGEALCRYVHARTRDGRSAIDFARENNVVEIEIILNKIKKPEYPEYEESYQGDSGASKDLQQAILKTEDGINNSSDEEPCYILCIDGGGIRGLIPALILEEIEKRTGKNIASMFQLVAGTSTGGIIALGLNKPAPNSDSSKQEKEPHYKASDMVQLYQEEGKNIFGDSVTKSAKKTAGVSLATFILSVISRLLPRRERFKQHSGALHSLSISFFFGSICLIAYAVYKMVYSCLYDNRHLHGLIDDRFDRDMVKAPVLSDALTNVMVTSYDVVSKKPVVFRYIKTAANEFHPGLTSDQVKMSTAAKATSAAPWYFDPVGYQLDAETVFQFIDGGIVANNPAILACLEAKAAGFNEKNIIVISIGTGKVESEYVSAQNGKHKPELEEMIVDVRKRHAGVPAIRNTLNYVFDSTITDSVLDGFFSALNAKDRYKRLNVRLEREVDLADASDQTIAVMRKAVEDFVKDNEEVISEVCGLINPQQSIQDTMRVINVDRQQLVQQQGVFEEAARTDKIGPRF